MSFEVGGPAGVMADAPFLNIFAPVSKVFSSLCLVPLSMNKRLKVGKDPQYEWYVEDRLTDCRCCMVRGSSRLVATSLRV